MLFLEQLSLYGKDTLSFYAYCWWCITYLEHCPAPCICILLFLYQKLNTWSTWIDLELIWWKNHYKTPYIKASVKSSINSETFKFVWGLDLLCSQLSGGARDRTFYAQLNEVIINPLLPVTLYVNVDNSSAVTWYLITWYYDMDAIAEAVQFVHTKTTRNCRDVTVVTLNVLISHL